MSIIEHFENELFVPEDEVIDCDLLLEISKQRLLGNTDIGRKKRARSQVRTRPLAMTMLDEKRKIWMMEYNFKAFPSVEDKRHWGFLLYEEPKKDIVEVFCDCKDFAYRLRAPMVKNKLSRWDMNTKYKLREPFIHNRKWTIKTNPSGRLFVCKHIAAALFGYID